MTKPVTSDLGDTLDERGKRYGDFVEQAHYAQRIKAILQSSPNWDQMDDDQREALDMLANKVARILNGDFNYADSWHDIAGYIKLVDDRLSLPRAKPAKAIGSCEGKPVYSKAEMDECIKKVSAEDYLRRALGPYVD